MAITQLPADLPKRLRAAGVTVVEVGDWEDWGRPAITGGFAPVGVLNHHTGGFDAIGDASDDLRYAQWMFRVGRDDLPAPLCHIAISAEGVVYIGAARRANHAGTAKSMGSVASGDGNRLYVGIEWMLSGTQPISDAQYDAGATTNAVLLDILGTSVRTVGCHFQTSVTGKWDIGDPNGVPFNGQKVLDVPKFRKAVQAEVDRLEKGDAPLPPTRVSRARTLLAVAIRKAELRGNKARAKTLRASYKLLPPR